MTINISIDATTGTRELDAITALIESLRNGDQYDTSVVPERGVARTPTAVVTSFADAVDAMRQGRDVVVTNLDGYPVPNPPSSSESGEASAPSISVTETGAYVADIPLPPAAVAAVDVPLPPVMSGAEAASASGVELDAEGLPWDVRIHSSNRKKTAKDVWNRKRNTDDAMWDHVRTELRNAMGAPAVPAVPLPPAPVHVPMPPETPTSGAADGPLDPASAFAPTVSAAPVATVAASVVPIIPPPPGATTSFQELIVRITGAQSAGKLTPEATAAACQSVGLTGVRELAVRPDLVWAVEKAIFG